MSLNQNWCEKSTSRLQRQGVRRSSKYDLFAHAAEVGILSC